METHQMSNEELLNKAWEKISKYKTVGILISVLMIIFGIIMFARPFKSELVLVFLTVLALLISGIEKIFLFFKMEKGAKDGWTLALGILWIITSIILFSSMYITEAIMLTMAGIFMGITAVFNGVADLCNCGSAEAMGRSKGLMIFAGILGILCGMIILGAPVLSTVAITIFYGVYLVILGIALLVRCLSIKKTA